jgi:hypothetical protein
MVKPESVELVSTDFRIVSTCFRRSEELRVNHHMVKPPDLEAIAVILAAST